jgi:plasmid stability protein
MATLHVRNVPEELHARLKKSADARHRSLSAEVIALLEWAVEGVERSTEATLSSIRRRRVFSPAAEGAPESTELLREDRRR